MTQDAFDARLLDGLTERQLEVLRTAYLSGYFSWPRESSADACADALGISQPRSASTSGSVSTGCSRPSSVGDRPRAESRPATRLSPIPIGDTALRRKPQRRYDVWY